MEKKRIIVMGGTGFIGGALCRELADAGYEVAALTRKPRPADGSVSYHVWDGRSADGWAGLADGAFAVVNLAGANISEGRWSEGRKRAILESRVHSGLAVAEAVRRAAVKPAVVAQASAVGYYGSRPSDERLDEASAPGKGFLPDVCLQWEESSRAVEEMGVRRVVLRTAVVLGRGGGALERMAPSFRLFAGGWPGAGRQGMPWIHLADEARAIRFILERDDLAGPFNLCAPEPVTAKRFCKALGMVLRRPCWVAIPPAALRAALGEMADELLLGGAMVVPRRLAEAGFPFRFPDLNAALMNIFA